MKLPHSTSKAGTSGPDSYDFQFTGNMRLTIVKYAGILALSLGGLFRYSSALCSCLKCLEHGRILAGSLCSTQEYGLQDTQQHVAVES